MELPLYPKITKTRGDCAHHLRSEMTRITGRDHSGVAVTCEDCWGVEGGCEFAWDHYNTHGDCLAAK